MRWADAVSRDKTPTLWIMHAKRTDTRGWLTPNYNVQIAHRNQYVTNYGRYDSAEVNLSMDFVSTPV